MDLSISAIHGYVWICGNGGRYYDGLDGVVSRVGVQMTRKTQLGKNRITEITRQEIIDLTVIDYNYPSTDDKIPFFWSGRLEEPTFLSRLYKVSELETRDSRYNDAFGDIYQHRVNNRDWEDDWVFYDSRFNVKNESDENFLRFLCEMFHPAVRNEKSNWECVLGQINKLLRIDGYELYEKSNLSNRAVYGWRVANDQNVVIKNQVENLMQKTDSAYIKSQFAMMNDAIEKNPYEAIGKAKELLETYCKTILENKGVSVGEDWDVPRLTREACSVLKLTPNDIDNTVKASETIKRLLGNLSHISQSMAELRNSYGSGHGKDAKFKGLSPRHARLAVGVSVTAVHFLLETFEEKHC